VAQGNFHLRAGVLPVEPMVFSADARARYRLPETQRVKTGARSAKPCWPTSRWSTGAAGVMRIRRSNRKTSSSGFLRITKYADELLETLHQLEGGWPERVLTMQRNWIGKSRGTRIRFAVDGLTGASIEVFTTRVDTIYGASALILAPSIHY